ncbi:MAG TPA: hypothetical protein VFH43_09345 [Candidatus Kapabacteria bacterium]|nr:hypothetical protein [Candidatus Kapabacteria bacterium]
MQKQRWRRLIRARWALGASLLVSAVLFNGCPYYDWDDYEYPAIVPKLMAKEDLATSIKSGEPRDLVKPGKIYTKDDLLFINEKYEGVHVINNADPATPVKLAFIEVPGCIDIAMKGNTLYVDNAIDLVALDVTDPQAVVFTERIAAIFPELSNQEAYWESMNFDRSKFVIVGWKDTVVKGGGHVE